MNKAYNLDTSNYHPQEKIADRCFKYCIREFIAEHLMEFEKQCLNTCKEKALDQYRYFNEKSLSAFKQ